MPGFSGREIASVGAVTGLGALLACGLQMAHVYGQQAMGCIQLDPPVPSASHEVSTLLAQLEPFRHYHRCAYLEVMFKVEDLASKADQVVGGSLQPTQALAIDLYATFLTIMQRLRHLQRALEDRGADEQEQADLQYIREELEEPLRKYWSTVYAKVAPTESPPRG